MRMVMLLWIAAQLALVAPTSIRFAEGGIGIGRQVAAALVAGNAVLAKPAEQTPLIAARAVALLHKAGVPEDVLHLLPGDGPGVGAPLTADPRIAGVCFTGSLATAKAIDAAMADHLSPSAPLIAETGGLNAMIVDSTALPEHGSVEIDDVGGARAAAEHLIALGHRDTASDGCGRHGVVSRRRQGLRRGGTVVVVRFVGLVRLVRRRCRRHHPPARDGLPRRLDQPPRPRPAPGRR